MIYIVGGCVFFLILFYHVIFQAWGKEKKAVTRVLYGCGWAVAVWGMWEFRQEWFNGFFSWWMLLAIPLAYVCYLLDSWITGFRLKKKYTTLAGISELNKKQKKALYRECFKIVPNVLYEEVLFRLILGEVLMNWISWKPVVILLMILYFATLHLRFDGKKRYVQMIDLTFFSIVLVVAYFAWGSLLFCVLLHGVRNMLVVMQRYIFFAEKENRRRSFFTRLEEGGKGNGEGV